jgi:hypothetical protein
MTWTHDVVQDVIASIAQEVDFQLVHEQQHIFFHS